MLFIMEFRSCTALLGVVGMTALLGIGTDSLYASTTQFYSWVTPSGEMVLTDDAGQIPSAHVRGPVSVHSFQTMPPSSSDRTMPVPSPVVSLPKDVEGPAEESLAAIPELLNAALEEPEQGLGANSDVLPFSSPFPVGSAPVFGFWSGRGVAIASPALARQVRQLQGLAPEPVRHQRVRGSSNWRDSVARSQRVWERQLRSPFSDPSPMTPSIGSMPVSHSHCCMMNHPRGSGRRGASRR